MLRNHDLILVATHQTSRQSCPPCALISAWSILVFLLLSEDEAVPIQAREEKSDTLARTAACVSALDKVPNLQSPAMPAQVRLALIPVHACAFAQGQPCKMVMLAVPAAPSIEHKRQRRFLHRSLDDCRPKRVFMLFRAGTSVPHSTTCAPTGNSSPGSCSGQHERLLQEKL